MQSLPRFTAFVLTCLVLSSGIVVGQSRLDVVTTLPDLADITKTIGGDAVSVTSIATGYQNPHFVDPKPSQILKLTRADMFVTVGLDLEIGWVPPLLNSARNPDIMKGGQGYVDASIGINLLQVPSSVSREQGDIHVYGNPHYWLDPDNGRIIAKNIADALTRLRPTQAGMFAANLESFNEELDRRMVDWKRQLLPFKNTEVIAYHNQWPYFEEAFGLKIAEFLEPKPGIPPTPSQLAKIIRLMTTRKIHVIIISPYYQRDSADLVARKVGGEVVELGTSVGAFPEIKSYFDLFDYNVSTITKVLAQSSQ
ncbi:MAG: metal ABC transporter substrate-binding protein [Rhodothermales bacterium]